MQLHQISLNYVAAQDRILARINTTAGEELRVWLTRRLCVALWPVLSQAAADQVASKLAADGRAESPLSHADDATRRMMADFERQATLGKADFKTPYQAKAQHLPLGQEPLLATEVGLDPIESGGLRFNFQEKLGAGAAQRGFQIRMDNTTLHGFMHMLDQALARSGWGLDNTTRSPAPLAEPATAPTPSKPKYLN